MAKVRARQSSEIGSRIREAAASVGLSLKDLGERLGVSRPTIYAYSTGALQLSSERIRQIAEITGRPEEFFEVAASTDTSGGHDFELLKQTIDGLLSAPNRILAMTLATRGAKVERARGDLVKSAELEHKAGNALLAEGNYLEAVERLTAAREMFLQEKLPQNAARSSQSLGYALINLGRLDRARQAFIESAENVDPKCRWMGEVSLASLAERVADFSDARERLERILQDDSYSKAAKSYATFSMASLSGSIGEHQESYRLNQLGLALAIKGGYKDQVIERFIQLGTSSLWMGRYEEASLWLMRAVDGASQLGDMARLTLANLALARLQLHVGRESEARESCVIWLSEATSNQYRRSEAIAIGLLAEIAYKRGDWEQARDYGMQGGSFCETHSYPVKAFSNNSILTAALIQLGDLDRAKSTWGRAHERFDPTKLLLTTAIASTIDAMIASAEHNLDHAVGLGQRSLTSLEELGLLPFASAERLRLVGYLQAAGKAAQAKMLESAAHQWSSGLKLEKIHLADCERLFSVSIDEDRNHFGVFHA